MELRLSGNEFDLYEFIEEGTPVGMATVERARRYPGVSVESFFICREHPPSIEASAFGRYSCT